MKLSNFFLLIIAILILNPRIDWESLKTRPKTIVSCSTGWSLQFGKGLLGVYSLETASTFRSSTFLKKYSPRDNLDKYKSLNQQQAKSIIMRPCEWHKNEINIFNFNNLLKSISLSTRNAEIDPQID